MTGLLMSLEISVNSLNLCDIYLGTTGERMYVSFGNGDSVTSNKGIPVFAELAEGPRHANQHRSKKGCSKCVQSCLNYG